MPCDPLPLFTREYAKAARRSLTLNAMPRPELNMPGTCQSERGRRAERLIGSPAHSRLVHKAVLSLTACSDSLPGTQQWALATHDTEG